jgi:hypothetical protein
MNPAPGRAKPPSGGSSIWWPVVIPIGDPAHGCRLPTTIRPKEPEQPPPTSGEGRFRARRAGIYPRLLRRLIYPTAGGHPGDDFKRQPGLFRVSFIQPCSVFFVSFTAASPGSCPGNVSTSGSQVLRAEETGSRARIEESSNQSPIQALCEYPRPTWHNLNLQPMP